MGILNDFNKRKGFRWEEEEKEKDRPMFQIGDVFDRIGSGDGEVMITKIGSFGKDLGYVLEDEEGNEYVSSESGIYKSVSSGDWTKL